MSNEALAHTIGESEAAPDYRETFVMNPPTMTRKLNVCRHAELKVSVMRRAHPGSI